MNNEHRVGSITFGVTLIALGVLFLVSIFWKAIPVLQIMRFWPCVFIVLGIEVLVANTMWRSDFKIDAVAIIMTGCAMVFAMGLAAVNTIATMAKW
ncbi:MAG: hypothetical protein GX685_04320 [Clostridiales bacterium]|nr:hypothetical protein [Clostridiales bacterium]